MMVHFLVPGIETRCRGIVSVSDEDCVDDATRRTDGICERTDGICERTDGICERNEICVCERNEICVCVMTSDETYVCVRGTTSLPPPPKCVLEVEPRSCLWVVYCKL